MYNKRGYTKTYAMDMTLHQVVSTKFNTQNEYQKYQKMQDVHLLPVNI